MERIIGLDSELTSGIVRFVTRWFIPVLAGALIGAGAGGLISWATPPQYRATAQLYVAPASASSSLLQDVTLGQSLARNYVPLVTAERVLRAAMNQLQFGYDLDLFRSRTQVAQVKDTSVITVSFADQDRSRAASAANAIVQAFGDQSSSLQASLGNSVNVWQEAIPPTRADSPNTVLSTTLGAIGGALLAVGIAWANRRRADQFTTMEAAAERLGVPVIAEIGRRERANWLDGALVVRDEPRSVAAVGFRALGRNLVLAQVPDRPRTILVTSAVPGEGKSFVSANLALALAQEQIPTILVDADLGGSSQQGNFGLEAWPSPLTDDFNGQDLEQWRVQPNLVVIPMGMSSISPATPPSSARISALVEELQRSNPEATLVIDTSPLLSDTDATAIATFIECCLVVIDASHTPVRVARRAIEVLRSVRVPILGVVLNKVSAHETAMTYGQRGSLDTTESSDRTESAATVAG